MTRMTRTCEKCHGPLAPHARHGICQRNPGCKKEAMRRRSRHAEGTLKRKLSLLSYRTSLQGWCHRALNLAKLRSKKKGVSFSLIADDLVRQFEFQGGRCQYCNMAFILNGSQSAYKQQSSPCLDEVIPGEGYHSWNIQLLCDVDNRHKDNMTAKEACVLADRITESTEQAWRRKHESEQQNIRVAAYLTERG